MIGGVSLVVMDTIEILDMILRMSSPVVVYAIDGR